MKQEAAQAEAMVGPLLVRRELLRFAGFLLCVPLVVALDSMLGRLEAAHPVRKVRLGPDLPDRVTFAGDAIVVKSADGPLLVFSAACTHLGCRITRLQDDELVCPCHGSRFRLDGTVARGPATRPLSSLNYAIDPGNGAIVVDLS